MQYKFYSIVWCDLEQLIVDTGIDYCHSKTDPACMWKMHTSQLKSCDNSTDIFTSMFVFLGNAATQLRWSG